MIKYELVQLLDDDSTRLQSTYRFEASCKGKVYFTAFCDKLQENHYYEVIELEKDNWGLEPGHSHIGYSSLEEFYIECVEKSTDKLSEMTWG